MNTCYSMGENIKLRCNVHFYGSSFKKKDSNNKIYMIAINCQSFPNCIAAMQLLTIHNTIIVDFKTGSS